MKFVIISDTHGRSDLVYEILDKHRDRDGVLFLGDGFRDISYYDCIEGGKLFAGVRGNCDSLLLAPSDYDFREEMTFPLTDEYTVTIMHGHGHNVKYSTDYAICHAARKGANILLFGHTHIPLEKYYPEGYRFSGYTLPRNMWVFNPGSVGASRTGSGSYGLMQIKDGQILFSHGSI